MICWPMGNSSSSHEGCSARRGPAQWAASAPTCLHPAPTSTDGSPPALSFPHLFCVQSLPAFRGLKQDQMENILDRFDARSELMQGETILNQGDLVRGMGRRTGPAWAGGRLRGGVGAGGRRRAYAVSGLQGGAMRGA